MKRFSIIFILFAVMSISNVSAKDGAALFESGNAINPSVIMQWKRAGALVGWLAQSEKGKWFYLKTKPKNHASLPVFIWRRYTPYLMNKLPRPSVPFAMSFGGTKLDNAGLTELTRFKNLQALDLSHTRVTDTGLTKLNAIKGLHSLDLGASKVTDKGLKNISRHGNLQRLYFGSTAVSDSGIRALKKLRKLKTLYLYNTKVSDTSLKHVAKMKNLQSILLVKTDVTTHGVRKLYKKRKSLRIWFKPNKKTTEL